VRLPEAIREIDMTKMPVWFGCKNCLFYKAHSSMCVYLPSPVEKYGEAYCAQWTCRRCWQRWDALVTNELPIDHEQCKSTKSMVDL
jgi:hypothetical protein